MNLDASHLNESGLAVILIVRGLAGALFGALFAGLYQVSWVFGLPEWQGLIVATTIASMTTAAFYGAMPVAMAGTMAGVLASIGYLIATGLDVSLIAMASLAGSAGVVAGSLHAWIGDRRGSRPLAETFNGGLAGLLASGLLMLILALTGWRLTMLFQAAIAMICVGILFQCSGGRLVGWVARWLPAVLSAPLVAGLIATVVGASIWFAGGTAAAVLEARGDPIMGQIPSGLLGGGIGGALSGLLRKLLEK